MDWDDPVRSAEPDIPLSREVHFSYFSRSLLCFFLVNLGRIDSSLGEMAEGRGECRDANLRNRFSILSFKYNYKSNSSLPKEDFF
jgi:hypothetical protein